jgi:hypothetical protein
VQTDTRQSSITRSAELRSSAPELPSISNNTHPDDDGHSGRRHLAFVSIEALIDDARRGNLFGLLMSLNMLIEFGDAFDYSIRPHTKDTKGSRRIAFAPQLFPRCLPL